MTRARLALPVFLQVALLVACSIALALGVAFAVILNAPPPPAPGASIDQVVQALQGQEVQTAEGKRLTRTLSARSPLPDQPGGDRIAGVISEFLQNRLDLEPDAVRVRMQAGERMRWTEATPNPGPPTIRRLPDGAAPGMIVLNEERRSTTVVVRDRTGARPASSPEVLTDNLIGGEPRRRITVYTEQLRFPPFTASVRLADGQWATVSPPTGLWSPWHTRILLTFLASLALLLPLAWFMARRLTRPIRLFAQAAERLGSDPHAPPLAETGPAEVRDAAQAFNDMQTKLNRYVEGRTQMVASIAHDLRTPLTRLRFRAEQADPEIRDRMAADIEQMDGMISQALAYVRGETVREDRVPLDLSALVASVVHDLNEVGADASVEAAPDVRVLGESLNLRRAVGNLVENAVKFAGAAQVAIATEPGLAVVTVADQGPGLPADELEAVFEPFQRGEKSRNRDTGGAGLGLAVARGVARAHGGDVVLSNRDGGGLEARLTLPLSPSAPI